MVSGSLGMMLLDGSPSHHHQRKRMNKRQRKKHEKKLGVFLAPWEMIEYESINALCGGQAMEKENMQDYLYQHRRYGIVIYPWRQW